MTLKLALLSLPLTLCLGVSGVAAKVTAEKVERLASGKVVVSWTAKAPVDVYMAERPDADIASATLVSGKDKDGKFETTAASRPFFLLKDTRDNTVVEVAERLVPLQQGSNFRDIGGYETKDGKRVKWGMIYRSGGTPLLTDADVAAVRGMGFTDMVDLRSSEERAMAPTRIEGIRYTAVGYSLMALLGDRDMPSSPGQVGEIYRTFPQMFAPQVRLVFDTLLDATPGPIVYNCAAGQDRTGFTTAMVLMALGVPRETVIADYQLSTAYRRPEFEVPRLDPAAYPEKSVQGYFARMQQDPRMSKPTPLVDTKQQPLLLNALEEIDRRWGSVDAYLAQEIGLDAADIAKLRQTYLE